MRKLEMGIRISNSSYAIIALPLKKQHLGTTLNMSYFLLFHQNYYWDKGSFSTKENNGDPKGLDDARYIYTSKPTLLLNVS